MAVWRLQTNTDCQDGSNIADLCINKNIMALGWSLKDKHLEGKNISERNKEKIRIKRTEIKIFDDYLKIVNKYNVYPGKGFASVKRLYYDVKPNDLVWIRNRGIYYIGRVGESCQWVYSCDEEMLIKDASNQRNNIIWKRVGDEGDIPGAISTSLIKGTTLQRIRKEGVEDYSKLLYNRLCGTECYTDIKLDNNIERFYSLLSTDDCEDLLCLWLYYKYRYIVIPSTNKKSTQLYECVLKNVDNNEKIYIQVKIGTAINAENYKHLHGLVYLFNTENNVYNIDKVNNNIKAVDARELYDFAMSAEGAKYLSPSILHWVNFLKKDNI